MQEVYHDGTEGKKKFANSLEELIPKIKEAFKNPNVNHVKLFIPKKRKK